MEKVNFYNFTLEELGAHLVSLGEKKFRAQQLYRWIYGQNVEDFEEMTNLSKDFRSKLPEMMELKLPEVITHLKSKDGTQKFLFDMEDNMSVEAVLIPSKDRRTLCVSSEVGCNLACKFCFTGKQKLKKRLQAWQIVGQFIQVSRRLLETERITNIVFMGMGEPLDNSEEVFRSIDILHSTWGVNFSRRKVTVSTSGIVPEMHKITDNGVRLAVSLNGADDETRSKIMPVNKRWPIEVLLDACREHVNKTGDRVTFEYVLLRGITDSLESADKLYRLTRDIPCKLNIIPFNEHPNSGFFRPDEEQIVKFQNRLIDLGAHVLRRKTMGRDIYAACGQLNSTYKNKPSLETNI